MSNQTVVGKFVARKFFWQIWGNSGKISFAAPTNCLLLHLCKQHSLL